MLVQAGVHWEHVATGYYKIFCTAHSPMMGLCEPLHREFAMKFTVVCSVLRVGGGKAIVSYRTEPLGAVGVRLQALHALGCPLSNPPPPTTTAPTAAMTRHHEESEAVGQHSGFVDLREQQEVD